MRKKPQNLSIFQILKQNTSLANKNKATEVLPVPRKKSIGETSIEDSLNHIKMIKTTQKYHQSDSESLSDKEDEIKDIESAKRRRKGSLDLFLQQEKEIKKKLHIKQEKRNKLLHKERIVIEGDETLKPVSNFTKMIRKFNLDENLVRNLQMAGYKKPTAVQMIAIPAMFKVNFY